MMLSTKMLAFALLLSATGLAVAQECSIVGRCQGTTLSTNAGGDKAQCVELCQGIEGCKYFTYDYDNTFCGAYQDCPTFDESCISCISGEDECPPLLCNAAGGCIGQLEDELNVRQFDSTVCEGCVTSEKDCQDGDSGENKNHILLAVTARTYDSISVIDLNNPDSNCDSISIGGALSQTDYPQTIQASYLNEKLFLYCDEAELGSYYDDVSGTWSDGPNRLTERYLPYSLDINNTFHLLTGGTNNGELDSTEYFDGSKFLSSLQLPLGVSDHCVVYLGGDEIMLVGGYGNYNGDAFIININTGESTTLPFPVSGELLVPQCGIATKSDGSQVVVVAGGGLPYYATTGTYIYDVSLGVFLPGPNLPQTRMFGRAVQYQNSFIIVGGASDAYSDFEGRENILFYDPDDEMWVTLPQKLSTPDYVTAAVLVSNDFNVKCS